jgi:hypothetical protein
MDRFQPQADVLEGELVTIQKAADILGVVPSTIHRWLNAGFIAGEQLTSVGLISTGGKFESGRRPSTV